MIALLDSPDSLLQREAMEAIGDRRLFDAAPALERMLAQDDPFLRLAAMSALAKLALAGSRPVFLEGRGDIFKWVRAAALNGLVAINDPGVISACENFYLAGNWVLKYDALYCLEHDDGREALGVLSRLLETERSWRWRRRIKKVISRK
jgi:HEAT repeat protein